MPARRDEEYAAVVERERPLIRPRPISDRRSGSGRAAHPAGLRTALTTVGSGCQVHILRAIRAVVTIARGQAILPWEHRPRVELIDNGFLATSSAAEPIVADLRLLSHDQLEYAIVSSGTSTRLPAGRSFKDSAAARC